MRGNFSNATNGTPEERRAYAREFLQANPRANLPKIRRALVKRFGVSVGTGYLNRIRAQANKAASGEIRTAPDVAALELRETDHRQAIPDLSAVEADTFNARISQIAQELGTLMRYRKYRAIRLIVEERPIGAVAHWEALVEQDGAIDLSK